MELSDKDIHEDMLVRLIHPTNSHTGKIGKIICHGGSCVKLIDPKTEDDWDCFYLKDIALLHKNLNDLVTSAPIG